MNCWISIEKAGMSLCSFLLLKMTANFDTKIKRGCILLDFLGCWVQNARFLIYGGANAKIEPFLQLIFVRVKGRFVLFQHLLLT